jgi:hypothetical protein
MLSNLKKRQVKKDSFTPSDIEILNPLSDIENQVKSTQKSMAFLFQVLPEKVREDIMNGFNECNRRIFPS